MIIIINVFVCVYYLFIIWKIKNVVFLLRICNIELYMMHCVCFCMCLLFGDGRGYLFISRLPLDSLMRLV